MLAHHHLAGLSVNDRIAIEIVVVNYLHRAIQISRNGSHLPYFPFFDERTILVLWCLVDDRMLLTLIVYYDVVVNGIESWDINPSKWFVVLLLLY